RTRFSRDWSSDVCLPISAEALRRTRRGDVPQGPADAGGRGRQAEERDRSVGAGDQEGRSLRRLRAWNGCAGHRGVVPAAPSFAGQSPAIRRTASDGFFPGGLALLGRLMMYVVIVDFAIKPEHAVEFAKAVSENARA